MKLRRRLPIRRGASLLVLSTAILHAAAARADLRVERGPNADACPDPATFAARASEGVPETRKRALAITVRFERTATGFASAVRTPDGSERALDDRSPQCDGLAEATLLAVRLAFDRDVEQGASPAPPAEDRVQAPRPAKTESTTHLELLAGGVGSIGITSSFAPGARVIGGLSLGSRGAWFVGLTGVYFVPQTEAFEKGTVEVGVIGGGLDACRRATFDLLGGTTLGVCARGEVARLSGSARGFAKSEEAARPLVTGSLLLRAHHRIAGALGGFAEVGGVVPVNRERFEIQGVGRVYDPPPVAGTGTIGLRVDFE